jgi:hypothetical protein
MSSVVISGDTSGAITLSAPAVSGTNTLTLPATTATLATLTTPSFATTIGVGGATPSTSGAGITFPATQSASADANTLDDYEEGTWTPNQGSGLVVVGTFTSAGRYTKIGRLVYISGRLTGSTSIQTVAGTEMFKNLPFTVAEPTAMGGFTNDNTTTTGGVAAFSTVAYSTVTTGVGANNNFDFSVTYSV